MILDGVPLDQLEAVYLGLKFILLIIGAPYVIRRSWRYWKRLLSG